MSPIPLFQWKRIFLPLGLILGLIQGSATLLQLTIVLHARHGVAPNGAGTLIPILLTITLVTLAHRVRLEVMIGWAICTFIALIGAVGFIWMPAAHWLGSQPMINWGWALLHHGFTPALALLLGWGVINQVTYLHQAARSYFALALIGALFVQGPRLALPLLAHLSLTSLLALTMGALFGALFAYKWLQTKLPEERWERDPYSDATFNPKILFGAALLAGGGVAASHAFQPVTGSLLMNNLPIIVHGIAILAFALVGALVAPLLLRRTGWSTTVIVAITFPLILGCATASLFLFGSGWAPWSALLYGAALTGVQSTLIFPLAQMLFLAIPPERRFAMTAWSLLWIFPLVSQLGDLLRNGVGSAPWLLTVSLLMAGSVIATAYWMGRSPSYRVPIR